MICGKCGAKNLDDATFCRECGAPLNEGRGENAATATRVIPAQSSQRNRKIGIIAVAVVVVVAAIVLIALLGGRSYRATVDQYIEATFSGNIDEMLELFPEEMLDYAAAASEGIDWAALENELGDTIRDYLDMVDSQYGSDWKVSHEILSVEDMSTEDLKDTQEDFRTIGVDVSAAKSAEVEITIQGSNAETTNTMNVPLIKCGRSWYVNAEGSFF